MTVMMGEVSVADRAMHVAAAPSATIRSMRQAAGVPSDVSATVRTTARSLIVDLPGPDGASELCHA